MVFIFFFLTYFTLYNRLQFYPPHLNWFKCILFDSWVILHCVYVPQLSYPFGCWRTSRLLPCSSYCKQCCNEHWGTRVSFNSGFLGWTLWEKVRVRWFERTALKHVYYHMWNRLLVQVQCMRQGTQGWCTGMTLRDGMGREMRGRVRMGNTCTPMADSCQCMAKTTTIF